MRSILHQKERPKTLTPAPLERPGQPSREGAQPNTQAPRGLAKLRSQGTATHLWCRTWLSAMPRRRSAPPSGAEHYEAAPKALHSPTERPPVRHWNRAAAHTPSTDGLHHIDDAPKHPHGAPQLRLSLQSCAFGRQHSRCAPRSEAPAGALRAPCRPGWPRSWAPPGCRPSRTRQTAAAPLTPASPPCSLAAGGKEGKGGAIGCTVGQHLQGIKRAAQRTLDCMDFCEARRPVQRHGQRPHKL